MNTPTYLSERAAVLAPVIAAFATGGAQAVISGIRGGTRDGYVSRAWCLAMTAVHGPTGTHPEQTQHPEVLRVKALALADLQRFLGVRPRPAP